MNYGNIFIDTPLYTHKRIGCFKTYSLLKFVHIYKFLHSSCCKNITIVIISKGNRHTSTIDFIQIRNMLAKAQTLRSMAIIRDSLPGCRTTENKYIFTILEISLFDVLATWRVLACSKVLVMQNVNQG